MLSADEFELLLPWYLNDTLAASDRALVDTYLQAHPEAQARVRWETTVRGAIQSQADELPADLGLGRALSDVRRAKISPRQTSEAGDDSDLTLPTRFRRTPDIRERTGEVPHPGTERPPVAEPRTITQLLQAVRRGDAAARETLFARAYGELKKLAHVRLYHSGRDDMLDTTALVSEAYIRFIQSSELRSEDRRSFFAFASQVMRNVIIDTARARLAQRRGGGATALTLSTQLLEHLSSGEQSILDVHEALLVLEQAEPRLAQLVEMRYFGGYTEAEIAETLGITERTVQRDWNKARLLLKVALERKR